MSEANLDVAGAESGAEIGEIYFAILDQFVEGELAVPDDRAPVMVFLDILSRV